MSISKASLSFDSNLILISGKSASGKSSIFDAIALCLSAKKRSSLYAEYVKQGKQHAKVLLDCNINGKPVNFNLQLNLVKGTPFQMELTYDGKVYKNTEAEEVIKSFDLEYYSDIIFSMQGDLDITQLSPTQRANYLQRLLNFDFIEQKDKIRKSLEQFKIQQSKIETDINIKEQFIKKETSEQEVTVDIVLTDIDIKNLQKDIKIKQDKIAEYQKNQEEILKLNNLLSDTNKKLIIFTNKKNEISNKINIMNEHKKLYETAEQELIDSNIELENTEIRLKEVEKIIQIKRSEIQELNNNIVSVDRKLEFTKSRLSEYERFADLEKQEKCPVCERETTEFLKEKLLNFTSIEYDGSSSHGHTMFDQLQIVKEKGDTFTNVANKIKSIYEKDFEDNLKQKLMLSLYNEELNKNIRDKATCSGLIESAETKKIKLQEQIKKLENNFDEFLSLDRELKIVEKDILDNKTLLKETELKIKEISKFNDITTLSNEIVELTNKINKYFSDKQTNEEIVARNKLRSKNIENYKKEIIQFQSDIKEIINKQNTYEDAYNVFDKILPNYMVIKTCASLQNEMNSFIQNVFPTYEVELQNSKKGVEFFYTKDKSLQEGTRKNNYIINAKMSSGFEKALLTLAFKVSLANLYHCDILILDEADGAADDESSLKLYETLINNNFNQVFLISHKNELKEFLQENCENILTYNVFNGNFTLDKNL